MNIVKTVLVVLAVGFLMNQFKPETANKFGYVGKVA